MTRDDAEKLVKALHAAGLEGAPPPQGWRESASAFLDVLGHLDASDVEIARREHLSSSTRWPSPAVLLSLVVGDRAPRTSSEERDGGCPDCRWTGWRQVRWVYRQTSGKLVERALSATCGCELGRCMHSAHLSPVTNSARGEGRDALPVKTANDHALALGSLRLVHLHGGPGLIAWRLSARDQSTTMGDEVEAALRAQAKLPALARVEGLPRLEVGAPPSRMDREPVRSWHERPDADSYDTDGAGAWA